MWSCLTGLPAPSASDAETALSSGSVGRLQTDCKTVNLKMFPVKHFQIRLDRLPGTKRPSKAASQSDQRRMATGPFMPGQSE